MSLRLFTYRALVYIFGPYKGIFPSICFFFFHCLKHLWGYLAQLRHLQTIQKNSFWLHKQSCFQGSTRALLQSFAITRAVICWTVTTATESQYCSIVICRTDVITCCQSAAKELRYSLQHYVLQSCDITNRPSLPALMTGGVMRWGCWTDLICLTSALSKSGFPHPECAAHCLVHLQIMGKKEKSVLIHEGQNCREESGFSWSSWCTRVRKGKRF